MINKLTLKQAKINIGNLSAPSKLRGYSYSIPANKCVTGAKLRKVKNSVCSGCYALKGNYKRFPSVFNALENRYNLLMGDRDKWIESMITVLKSDAVSKQKYFRWHDAGDLQDLNHLIDLVYIAEQVPELIFWIPTREYKIVKDYLKLYGKFPDNFILRLSAHMIGEQAPKFHLSSTVNYKGFDCIAPKQANKCGSCTACWNPKIQNINYKLH